MVDVEIGVGSILLQESSCLGGSLQIVRNEVQILPMVRHARGYTRLERTELQSLKARERKDVSIKAVSKLKIAESVTKEMERKQPAAADVSSSAYCSTVEELPPAVPVTSDSVYASALEDPPASQVTTSNHQHLTSIDYSTENEDDYNFVRVFPGRQIRKIENKHLKLLEQIQVPSSQGTIHTAQVHRLNAVSGEYEPENDRCIAKVFNGRNCGQWPERVFGLHFSNQYICQFYGYCIDGESFTLVMKKYDCSLRDVLDRQMKKSQNFHGRPLRDVDAVVLIIQIALGMRFLHENDILHRDLKADNIFVILDSEGIPSMACIGDFDVASNVVGTLFWRAPEVLQALKDGKRPVFTTKADVYSYAMICYEILTGDIPFDGVRRSQYDVVLSGKRPKLPSNLNPQMKDFINRCWHQDPSMRPTFNEIVVDLQGLHRELIKGSEIASKFIDQSFDASISSLDVIGANPESCLVELKELLQMLLVKYNQADFLVLGCEIVADMEQFQSQFGLQSFEQQQQLFPLPYWEWFARMILYDNILWKFQVFLRTVSKILEVVKIQMLMRRIIGALGEKPQYVDEKNLTDKEMVARYVEFSAWVEKCRSRVLPENQHDACWEQLHNGSGDDGFQACDFCKSIHHAEAMPEVLVELCLYVDKGSIFTKFIPSSLFSSLQEMSDSLF